MPTENVAGPEPEVNGRGIKPGQFAHLVSTRGGNHAEMYPREEQPETPTEDTPEDTERTDPRFVTVLRSFGPRLVKRWHLVDDGPVCGDTERAGRFRYRWERAETTAELAALLRRLGPRECIIPGTLLAGIDPRDQRRIRKPGGEHSVTIRDRKWLWFPFDLDSIAPLDDAGEFDPIAEPSRAVAVVVATLPEWAQEADMVIQFTGGHGLKPGIRARVFVQLGSPLGIWEMAAIAERDCDPGTVDLSLYQPEREIYCGPTVFDDGIADPVADRVVVVDHYADAYPPLAPAEAAKKAAIATEERPETDSEPFPFAEALKLLPFISPNGRRHGKGGWAARLAAIAGGNYSDKGDADRYAIGRAFMASLYYGGDEPKADGEHRTEDQVDAVVSWAICHTPAGLDKLETFARCGGWQQPGASVFGHVTQQALDAAEAAAAEWGKPVDIFGMILQEPVFRLDMLPAPIARFAEPASRLLGQPPVTVAMQCLVACAAVIDDRHQIVINPAWRESARLWIARLDDASSGKTAAQKLAFGPVYLIEKEQHAATRDDRKAYRAAKRAKGGEALPPESEGPLKTTAQPMPDKPAWRTLVVGEATTAGLRTVLAKPENEGGVCLVHDELASLFGGIDSHARGDAGQAEIVKLWEGLPKTFALAKNDGAVYCPNWGASISGNIQKAKIAQYLRYIVDDGFLSRFILFDAGAPDELPDHKVDLDTTEYQDLIHQLFDLGDKASEVRFPPEAFTLFRHIERIGLRTAQETGIEAFAYAARKMPRQFARFVLVYHAIESVSASRWETVKDEITGEETLQERQPQLRPEVSAETVRKVARLFTEYLWPTIERIYIEMYSEAAARETFAGQARLAARFILANGKGAITGRDIARGVPVLRPAEYEERRKEIGDWLAARGWLKRAAAASGGARWLVNPRLFEVFADLAQAEATRRRAEAERIGRQRQELRESLDTIGRG